MPDYENAGDDGGAVIGRVKWEAETESRPIELECGVWRGVEVRATQDLWTCKGFNYAKLWERARKVAGDICGRSLHCPADCPNLKAIVVESSWGCTRARVPFLWFHLNLYRAEARVRWAIGCENAKKLPELPHEPAPEPKDFESPRKPPERDDAPDPEYVIVEPHGFGGPPRTKDLPCNKLTTIRFTYHGDADGPNEPDDYKPFIDKALDVAKIYIDSFWCVPPCFPMPTYGVTRKEWSWDEHDEGVDVVLYITFMCTPANGD